MQVNTINQAGAVNYTDNKNVNAGANGSLLDINDFFKLISAQLQNQSMFNPADDTQFMSQMAQFTTLQQIRDLSNVFQSTYAVSLIGKNVRVNGVDDSGVMRQTTGIVDKIDFQAGKAGLYVNGDYYQVSNIVEVLK